MPFILDKAKKNTVYTLRDLCDTKRTSGINPLKLVEALYCKIKFGNRFYYPI